MTDTLQEGFAAPELGGDADRAKAGLAAPELAGEVDGAKAGLAAPKLAGDVDGAKAGLAAPKLAGDVDGAKAGVTRRELFQIGNVLAMPVLLGGVKAHAEAGSVVRAEAGPLTPGPQIYQSIGVEPVINCRGTFTII